MMEARCTTLVRGLLLGNHAERIAHHHEVSERRRLHLLHDAGSMNLDGGLGNAE